MVKNYLLDTNLFMSNPNVIFGFEDNNIYLCGTVLQELDKHKDDVGECGYNTRESIRILKNLIKDNFENKTKEERLEIVQKIGIDLPNGGKLFFEPDGVKAEYLPLGYDISIPDNKIISSCIHMNKTYLQNNPVTLLTNDGACYIKALACGINADDVHNEQVEDISYTGHLELTIKDWTLIDKLYKEKDMDAELIKELDNLDYPLLENQFVTISCGTKSILTVYYKNQLHKINDITLDNNIKPLNKMQTYAMWALMNPNIPLVILEGEAGTSKTFLSLACGLAQLDMGDHRKNYDIYGRMLISKPNTRSSDQEFGYLPGDLLEKMSPLIASYMDNLEEILGDKDTPILDTRQIAEDLMFNGFIELCPLYTIRGRSIHNAYLICDEAQNASKLLIRDIVTRAGRNTKIVVAGDTRQVDNPALDKRNNGLVYLKDCMKGSPNCAIIKFNKSNCVRSDLAEDAINRMK